MSKQQYSASVGARALAQAAKFWGLSEIKSNSKWDKLDTPGVDPVAEEFRAELMRVGWQPGWPYCAAFAEVCYRYAYQGRPELAKVKTMLTPGCLLSFFNAADEGWTSQVPQIGAIGIMRHGATSNGHAFLVRGIDGTTLHTIEANTSPGVVDIAKDREGDGVYMKTRALRYKPVTGLHLIGFIIPCVES